MVGEKFSYTFISKTLTKPEQIKLFRTATGYIHEIPRHYYTIVRYNNNFSIIYSLQVEDIGFDIVMQVWNDSYSQYDYYIIAESVMPDD